MPHPIAEMLSRAVPNRVHGAFHDMAETSFAALVQQSHINHRIPQDKALVDRAHQTINRYSANGRKAISRCIGLTAALLLTGATDPLGEAAEELGIIVGSPSMSSCIQDTRRRLAGMTRRPLTWTDSEAGTCRTMLAVAHLTSLRGQAPQKSVFFDLEEADPLMHRLTYIQATLKGLALRLRSPLEPTVATTAWPNWNAAGPIGISKSVRLHALSS